MTRTASRVFASFLVVLITVIFLYGIVDFVRYNYIGKENVIQTRVVGKVTSPVHVRYHGKRKVVVPEIHYLVLEQTQDMLTERRVYYWSPVAGDYDYYFDAIPVKLSFWNKISVGAKIMCRCFKGNSAKNYQAKLIWTLATQ